MHRSFSKGLGWGLRNGLALGHVSTRKVTTFGWHLSDKPWRGTIASTLGEQADPLSGQYSVLLPRVSIGFCANKPK